MKKQSVIPVRQQRRMLVPRLKMAFMIPLAELSESLKEAAF